MAAVKLPFKHPQVTLQNDILELCYRNNRYKISVENISKIYLSKRKTTYLNAIIDNLLLMRSVNFKLFIHTKDRKTYSVAVPGNDKQLFVNLVSWIRRQIALTTNQSNTEKHSASTANNGAFAA